MVLTKISVVVPVYNAEHYLENAIKSVLLQTYPNIELILVDDGSTDTSGALCDEYASVNTNIKVFHNKNCGVSAARIFGAKHSAGEWVCFLDADDILPAETLKIMMSKSNDADIVIGNKQVVCGNDITYELMNTNDLLLPPHEFLYKLIMNDISQFITGRMFRKILFESGNISVPREIVMAEDFIMNVQLGNNAKRVQLINDVVYRYNVYPLSVSHTFHTNLAYESMFCTFLHTVLKQGSYYKNCREVRDAFAFQEVRSLKAAFMAQKGRIDFTDSFLKKVCKDAKNITLTKGWRLFLFLLSLRHIGYVLLKMLKK